MKKLYNAILIIGIIIAAVLAFTPAHATCTGGSHGCGASSGANSPVSVSNAQARSRASSRAAAAAQSTSISTADGGKADATAFGGSSTAEGGDASGQQVTFQGDRTPRQTPPAFAGTVQPTASCKGALNAGASTPVAAVSFGKDRPDDECDLRETARMFYEMEERALAVKLLCTSKAAQRLKECAPSEPAPDLIAIREQRIVEHGGPNFSK